MPKRSSSKKPATDPNVAAHQIIQRIIELTEGSTEPSGKDPLAVALGRRGGLKGGPARAAKLSEAKRSAIARKAAAARWKKP